MNRSNMDLISQKMIKVKKFGLLSTHLLSFRPILLLSFVIYTIIWLSCAHNMKRHLIYSIAYNNETRPSVSVSYGDISMKGYPFTLDAEIKDVKLTINSAEPAKFIASIVKNNHHQFPSLTHKQVYSTLEQPLIVSKNIFAQNYNITFPKSIVTTHYFKDDESLNLIYRFTSPPYIKINKDASSFPSKIISQKLQWLYEIHDFSAVIPSYQLRELNGDALMSESQGISLSLHADNNTSDGIAYNIKYMDLGTRYTQSIENLLTPLMQTDYFQYLSHSMPMPYEELSHVNKYIKAGEHKLNMNAKIAMYLANYDQDDKAQIDIDLIRLEQLDDYGSLNATGSITGKLHHDKLNLSNQGYLAISLKESWHNKWLNNIDRAFRNISGYDTSIRDKLKILLPNIHDYQYVIMDYGLKYDGDLSLDFKSIALDHLSVQTDEFAISAKRQDTDESSPQFLVQMRNYPKLIQVGASCLQSLLNTSDQPSHNLANKRIINEFSTFLQDVQHKHGICRVNWNGYLKRTKEEWYLSNYRLSTIQSIILAIALKANNYATEAKVN